MATKAVPAISRRTGTDKLMRNANDFATLRDAANIVNAAIANYHELHHTPWYKRLWRRIAR